MDFEYEVVFSGNKVLTDGPGIAANGGGMCIASSGDVLFEDFASFTANEAERGGLGGAVANFGYLVFKRASTFASNIAKGEFGELLIQLPGFYTHMLDTCVNRQPFPALVLS